ncbi:MarR family winged helix-turn-helix transcriptional regulator [Jiella sp. M17.18]|uniref:MarR family winged helix-turn-helix transcriptional regulator n=1 Tax=Jiella sp. M17.18 TaxID=3234247 RepID=UPI0034DF8540
MRTTAPPEPSRRHRDGERSERVRLGALEDYIGFHLRLAQNASFKAFKRRAGQNDLRPGRFAVLSLIHDNPGITPVAVSLASGRDKSTITPILRDLDKAGLIIRCPVPSDRRSHSLRLTEAGEEMLAHLARCAAEHDRELDRLVGDRKPELLALLRRIVAGLE